MATKRPSNAGRPASRPADRPAARGSARARREQERRRHQRQRLAWAAAGAGVMVALALGLLLTGGTSGPASGPAVPSGPTLAPINPSTQGQVIDGISCQTSEQVLFHIHAHLAVFVSGQQNVIPAGIGIPGAVFQHTSDGPFVGTGTCFYWLHSHTADGVIHIESPLTRTYTLGNYFDIWGQPLDATHVGPATGPVTAYVDGQRYTGNPRDVALNAHTVVQLDVGTDVAPRAFSFPAGL
jgi:hypothetical protein